MKSGKHTITFASATDAQCVALAKLGISDSYIERDCKLSKGQISYRLRKAKDVEGNQHGYRVAWRRGESPVFQQVRKDILAILRQEVQRTLPMQIVKPEPEVAP